LLGNSVTASPLTIFVTIPGIDRSSAITIISEIGMDMAQFGSSKRLCCWAGLTPGNNESAGKKKSVRISRKGLAVS
jgi:transposase